MIPSVHSGIVRILGPNRRTVGTGFIVSRQGLIATCAHVVLQAGAGPGDTVSIAFCDTAIGRAQPSVGLARVEPAWWRDAGKEDVAILRLEQSGEDTRATQTMFASPLTLGSSFGVEGRTFFTFGFPAAKPVEGLPGKCEVVGRSTEDGHPVLTLRSNEISYGFSGAPVWDNKTGAVIGMVVSTIPVGFDPARKQSEVSFIIPVETLRQVCEPLALVEQSPYRGLEAFEAIHEQYYFGRDGAMRDMIDLLVKHDFVSVVGVSGSGKSSLVRAGLAKGLRAWKIPGITGRRVSVFKLGSTPFINLALALSGLGGWIRTSIEQTLGLPTDALAEGNEITPDSFNAIYDRDPEVLAKAIRPSARDGGVILVADQFERLYTECLDEHVRRWFIKFLLTLAGDDIKVLIATRADFYSLALEHLELGQAIKAAQITLLPMMREELDEAIKKPASLLNRTFEPGMVDRLIADVSERAGDLPLLQFALTELWDRDADKGILTLASYEALGYTDPDGLRVTGVRGIIVKRAEEIWRYLSEEKKLAAQKIFLTLIAAGPNLDNQRLITDTSRSAWQAEWDTLTREVAQELASSFLLTAGVDAFSGEPTVEVAHEALIRAWPRLQQWVKDFRPFVSWYDRDLSPYHRKWLEGKRNPALLLPRLMFDEALRWLDKYPALLSGPPAEYITASVQTYEQERAVTERRKRRYKQFRIGAGALLLILASIVLFTWQRYRAKDMQARLNLARNLDEGALISLANHEMLEAEVLFAKSLTLDDRRETREHLLEARARGTRFAQFDRVDGAVLAISQDGSLAILGTEEGDMKVWSVGDGKETYKFPRHRGSPVKAAISPDNRLAAYAFAVSDPKDITRDGAVYVWDIQRQQPLSTLELHPISGYGQVKQISNITFSPSGRLLAYAGEDGPIRLWDLDKKHELSPLLGHTRAVWGISFNPAETQVASTGSDNTLRLWDIAAAKEIRQFSGHEGTIRTVVFDPKGARLASGSTDATVRVWDVKSGNEIRAFTGYLGAVDTLAFSPNGHLLISGAQDETVRVLDLDLGMEMLKLRSYAGPVLKVAFGADGQRIIAGGKDNWIRQWDTERKREVLTLNNYESAVRSVAFNPKVNQLASGDAASKVRLWDLDSGAEITPAMEGHKGNVYSVAFDPSGRLLASGGADGILRLWSLSDKKKPHEFPGHTASIWGIAFSPTAPLLASGSFDRTIRLWDTKEMVEIATIQHEEGAVWNLAFSPDGALLASAGGDRSVRVWNVSERKELYRFYHKGEAWGVAFSPQGAVLASSSTDRTVRLWSLKDNRELYQFKGHEGTVNCIAFDPKGEWIASGSVDQTVRLWNVNSKDGFTLRIHQRPIWWVAFSPDGRRLASAGLDRKIQVWDMDTIKLIISGPPSTLFVEAVKDSGLNLDSDYNFTAQVEGGGPK